MPDLAASWYFGNNMAGVQMYYPDNGRVFDGINGPVSWRVNHNSGAESTIEGLDEPDRHRGHSSGASICCMLKPSAAIQWQILEAEDGDRVIGTPIYYTGDWTGEGYISARALRRAWRRTANAPAFAVTQEDDYLLYVAHMHQASGSSSNVIQRADAPPTIDGSGDDWSPTIPDARSSNTAQQFLRGAGLWQGADVDSHSIRLQWDDDNLYVFADVRDPQLRAILHAQQRVAGRRALALPHQQP